MFLTLPRTYFYADTTFEFDNYFVIVPSIVLWSKTKFKNQSNREIGKPCPDGFSYNSKSNKHFLSVEELRELIKTL